MICTCDYDYTTGVFQCDIVFYMVKTFCASNPVTQIIYFSAVQVEVALIEQINEVGGNTSPSVPVN